MKKDRPLVSIIVPFFNNERYVKECMDSLLNQDYDNIEIIALDDGSTDSTLEKLNQYKTLSDKVKIFEQKNSGVSAARNNALTKATGDYVCFVDQDDTIDDDYISYLLALIKDNDADISLTYQPFKFNKTITKKQKNGDDSVVIMTGEDAAEQMLYYNFVIAPWNKMISTELIRKNGIRFDDKLFGGEGFKFSIDCFMAATKVAVGRRKVYNYRCDNPTSGMTKFRMEIVDSSILAQKLIYNEIKNSDRLKKAQKYSNWHTHADLLNSFIGCKVVNKYKKRYREIKKVVRRGSLSSIKAPVGAKEKIKGICYFLSPVLASKIVNRLRVREFTVEKN